MSLILHPAPAAFAVTDWSLASRDVALDAEVSPGAFLNYDFDVQGNSDRYATAAFTELGVFNRFGTGTTTWLWRDIGAEAAPVRLETTWTRDVPARMATLRIGDAVSAGGSFAPSLRFAGVQWASNDDTRPGFAHNLLPAVSAEAVTASTVDIFINDALLTRREVPPGPFTLNDLPLVNGQGEARIVVRDLLGREQVMVLPYYASAAVLDPGRSEYSYEAGFLRSNFATESNDYGRFFAAATHRYGLLESLTIEGHAESDAAAQVLGGGLSWLLADTGVLSFAAAGSRSDLGDGRLVKAAFERRSHNASFAFGVEHRDDRFIQIGDDTATARPGLSGHVYLGYSTERLGSFGLSYVARAAGVRQDPQRRATLSYNSSFGEFGMLGLAVSNDFANTDGRQLSLTFTRSLGRGVSSQSSFRRNAESSDSHFSMQRNAPAGAGLGWRVSASPSDSRYEAGIRAQSNFMSTTLETGWTDGRGSFHGGASGGFAYMDSHVFAGRRIDQSFALVEVPGQAGVTVYADNQPVARTDSEGFALVSSLRAYQHNPIRIDMKSLPIDAVAETLELSAVPAARSGLKLQFPIISTRSAMLSLVRDDGSPVPAGAEVRAAGSPEPAFVALEGRLYLTNPTDGQELQVRWATGTCNARLPKVDWAIPMPELGTLRCTVISQ